MIGRGSATQLITEAQASDLLAEACADVPVDGKRVLALIPDGTRHAPIPLLFRLLYEQLGDRVQCLDYLIALGTHPPMSEASIARLVGCSAAERKARYPKTRIFNHAWDRPEQLRTLGTISRREVEQLTEGLLSDAIPVTLNRMIHEYDHLVICGPVFPHEVVGFSGGAKYLFPGIAGPEIINATHWLGALVTSMRTIGVKDTPVRRVIHRAAGFVDRPILCVALAVKGQGFHGLFAGDYAETWSAAADLSSQLEVIVVPRAFRRVLSMASNIYDDLWTGGKAMYKTEPAVADGGEVVIYAPHLNEISYTHGRVIDGVGYHVRDYFTKQGDRFASVPGMIKAHSTHVKGSGGYDATSRLESPRIQVTLATAIPEARCHQVNLGFLDYREIDPLEWADREDEGLLVVPNAGEMLYRAADLLGQETPVASRLRSGGY